MLSWFAKRRLRVGAATVAASVATHVQEAAKAFGISDQESASSIILVTHQPVPLLDTCV